MNHGVGTIAIFGDDADRRYFIKLLKEHLQAHAGKAHAWCLMTNHFHLLVEMPLSDLSEFMRNLTSEYAARFNQKYQRKGHLFMQRFKSEPVENEAYFITVVRYIHQNPVKAGISRTCEYRWSSYREYAHGERKLCSTALVISMFGGVSWLILYHNELVDADECLSAEPRHRMSDGEVAKLVRRAFRRLGVFSISGVMKSKRDVVIRKLLADGVPVNQLARVLGVGRAVVRDA